MTNDLDDVRDQIRVRLSIRELGEMCGVVWQKAGGGYKARCPFHEERTASFAIDTRAQHWTHAHCFGCGKRADIFDLWGHVKGRTYPECIEDLARVAGVRMPGEADAGNGTGADGGRREREPVQCTAPLASMPAGRALEDVGWPEGARDLTRGEMEEIARHRYLEVETLMDLQARGRIFGCVWPQKQSGGWPSYGIRSERGYNVQMRRIDNKKYPAPGGAGGGEGIKGLSKQGSHSTWPIGVEEIGDRARVNWVEGGPDILAMEELVRRAGLAGEIAVCGMFGAGPSIHAEALPLLAGKVVRIFVHADKLKEFKSTEWQGEPGNKKRVPLVWEERPGWVGAGRWQAALVAAGAMVEVVVCDPLEFADGSTGKDVNDVVRWIGEQAGAGVGEGESGRGGELPGWVGEYLGAAVEAGAGGD